MKIRNTINCPICHGVLTLDREPRVSGMQGACQAFECYTPLDKMPLHYYSHMVRPEKPNKIISQEFSVDLGNRWVLVTNNYLTQKSYIRAGQATADLEVSTILVADFPNMENLKNKIKMVIVFS
jgi:hypothetical protein